MKYKSDKTILVMGATGQQGGAVLRHLYAQGWKLRAFTRDADKPSAKEIEHMGIEVYEGDYKDNASLYRALDGVYGVFCVTTPFEEGFEEEVSQGVAMADAALASGVQHFVYSSVGSADRDTGIPHFDGKYKVERYIREIGLPATIVRPVYLMDNFWYPNLHDSILDGTLAFGAKADRKIQMIAVDDVGYSVALIFERPEKYIDKTMELAGDELSMSRAAEVLSDAMGCTISFMELPVDMIKEQNEDYGLMLEWFEKGGYNVDIPTMRVFHPSVLKFEDWVRLSGWDEEPCKTPAMAEVDEK
jgi:uncharacterized protein YbjT (DUF2867 family)